MTAPRATAALLMDAHAPLTQRNDPRTMISVTRLGRRAVIEYTTLDGKRVSPSAPIFDHYRLGIAGAHSILAWDAIRTVELRGD